MEGFNRCPGGFNVEALYHGLEVIFIRPIIDGWAGATANSITYPILHDEYYSHFSRNRCRGRFTIEIYHFYG